MASAFFIAQAEVEGSSWVAVSFYQQQGMEVRKSQDLTWVSQIAGQGVAKLSARELIPVITGLRELISGRSYSVLDMIFSSHNPDSLQPEMIVSLLRTTYPVHQELVEWRGFLHRAKASLTHRKFNAQRILIGLI